jgi:Tfp pilus assembly pilus retraction ATPase PilT
MKNSKTEGLTIIEGKTGDGQSATFTRVKEKSDRVLMSPIIYEDPVEYEFNKTLECNVKH